MVLEIPCQPLTRNLQKWEILSKMCIIPSPPEIGMSVGQTSPKKLSSCDSLDLIVFGSHYSLCFRKVMHGVSSDQTSVRMTDTLVVNEQVGFGVTVLSVLSVTQLLL